MPLGSVTAMNKSLDNDYGTTRGPNAAASHQVALFAGDPLEGGVEATTGTCPGYARVALTNGAAWGASVDGIKSTVAPVQFPNATAEWTDTLTHFALYDGATLWDCAPLDEPIDVTASGAGPAVLLSIFYSDTVTLP